MSYPYKSSSFITFTLIFCATYTVDFFSKMFIISTMQEGQSKNIIGSFLKFTFVRNSGAAFSIGENFTLLFTLISFIVIGVILFFMKKVTSLWWALSLGLLCGGTAGNVTDRLVRAPGIFHGKVIDFIQVPYYAIFNLADCAIVGGSLLMMVLVIRNVEYTHE